MKIRIYVIWSTVFALVTLTAADVSHTMSLQDYQNRVSIEQDSCFYHVYYRGAGPSTAIVADTGAPEMPMITVNMIIPRGEKVDSVSVTSYDTSFYSKLYVYPIQVGCGTCLDDTIIPNFVLPNANIYNSSDLFPDGFIWYKGHGYFDGAVNIASVLIPPVFYIGQDTSLIALTSISFTLHTTTIVDSGFEAQNRSPLMKQIYKDFLENYILNTSDIDSFTYEPDSENVSMDFLIITRDTFVDDFCPFAEWKRDMGFKVVIRTVEWIDSTFAGDTISDPSIDDEAGRIREYASYCYQDSGLGFLLAAGSFDWDYSYVIDDTVDCEDRGSQDILFDDDVPIRVVHAPRAFPFNGYYADYDMDWAHQFTFADGCTAVQWTVGEEDLPDSFYYFLPEVFAGRLPCLNSTDIEIWTRKLINYEKYPGCGVATDYLEYAYWEQADNAAGISDFSAIADCIAP